MIQALLLHPLRLRSYLALIGSRAAHRRSAVSAISINDAAISSLPASLAAAAERWRSQITGRPLWASMAQASRSAMFLAGTLSLRKKDPHSRSTLLIAQKLLWVKAAVPLRPASVALMGRHPGRCAKSKYGYQVAHRRCNDRTAHMARSQRLRPAQFRHPKAPKWGSPPVQLFLLLAGGYPDDLDGSRSRQGGASLRAGPLGHQLSLTTPTVVPLVNRRPPPLRKRLTTLPTARFTSPLRLSLKSTRSRTLFFRVTRADTAFRPRSLKFRQAYGDRGGRSDRH